MTTLKSILDARVKIGSYTHLRFHYDYNAFNFRIYYILFHLSYQYAF